VNAFSSPFLLLGLLQPTTNNQDIHLPKGEQGPVLIINPSITLLSQAPNLQQLILPSIENAIREILTPVVERSVMISCITTRELTLKDFAGGESNPPQLQEASHMMGLISSDEY
jgi:hypothetical protein